MPAMDRIFIHDLELTCVIGLNESERAAPQRVLVDVSLFTDVRDVGRSDDRADILDYKAVAKAIAAYVEASEHYLVEALATAIARICVVEHGAERVVVRVQKPGALRLAGSVGVEIERSRDDFAV
jgi:FolB domain-containing protein